jgi:hypothetical protein
MPFAVKYPVTNVISVFVYYPLARFALLLEKMGVNVSTFPLSEYRSKSFYTMRTDALDRFGTRLEQRFTKAEIKNMLEAADLIDIEFSDIAPFWCAIGYRK